MKSEDDERVELLARYFRAFIARGGTDALFYQDLAGAWRRIGRKAVGLGLMKIAQIAAKFLGDGA